MSEQKSGFEGLMQKLDEEALSSVYIDTGVKETTPDEMCYPVNYRYIPFIDVTAREDTYSLEGEGIESPDLEAVRLEARVESYRIAFIIAEGLPKKSDREIEIKIDDLPLGEARKLLELYEQEFQRVQEAHKDMEWL